MRRHLKCQSWNRVRHPELWSIQTRATKKHDSPLVRLFSFVGLAGLTAISLGYPHLDVSFKRTSQVDIPVSVDVV